MWSSVWTPSSAIIVVDPISTGGSLAFEAYISGYAVIAVWCDELLVDLRSHTPDCCKTRGFRFSAEVNEQASITETADKVRLIAQDLEVELVACIVGGESGVTLADALSQELGLRSNGVLPSGDRRNKSVQRELVHASGLRAVRESLGTQWSQVVDFVDNEKCPIVLKPVESAGSDGVKLCRTKQEAKDHFHLLMSSQRVNGGANAAVLCQEFLQGDEYVVDHVSRDGVHKTVMVWRYDKRPTNGAEFVYYGMIPVDSSTAEALVLIKYTRDVLDALELANGPTHGEIMMTSTGPCLVEMNCRSHGWMGGWVPLAVALTGYAQPSVALCSYLDADAFAEIPDVPVSPFRATGQTVMLVSFFRGRVKATPGYEQILQLPSFVSLQTDIGIGSRVHLTVDLATAVGVLVLSNSNALDLEADLARVRAMEREGLFVLSEEEECLSDTSTDNKSPHASAERSSSPPSTCSDD